MPTNNCGILLAAGFASRFGEQKLLYTLPNGIKILESAARTLKQALPNSIAVVRSDSDEIAKILTDEGYKLVVNPNPDQGMGSSIQCGIRHTTADAWVITLADMPYIKTQTISKIIDFLDQGKKIVAPSFKKQRGHPVGFNSTYKDQLLELHEDIGAKNILQSNKDVLEIFETDDSGVIEDIDRKQDIKTLYA